MDGKKLINVLAGEFGINFNEFSPILPENHASQVQQVNPLEQPQKIGGEGEISLETTSSMISKLPYVYLDDSLACSHSDFSARRALFWFVL